MIDYFLIQSAWFFHIIIKIHLNFKQSNQSLKMEKCLLLKIHFAWISTSTETICLQKGARALNAWNQKRLTIVPTDGNFKLDIKMAVD